jgi:hypothetical protein
MRCKTCGLPYPAGNETWGYAGAMCIHAGDHTPRPIFVQFPPDAGSYDQPSMRPARYLTEEDVMRLIHQELMRLGIHQ